MYAELDRPLRDAEHLGGLTYAELLAFDEHKCLSKGSGSSSSACSRARRERQSREPIARGTRREGTVARLPRASVPTMDCDA